MKSCNKYSCMELRTAYFKIRKEADELLKIVDKLLKENTELKLKIEEINK